MNTDANKELRRQYVQRASQYMRNGNIAIWMDETNLNLFCRRSQGRARVGERAVMALPTSKGPNIHVVCALSAYQIIYMTRGREAFKAPILPRVVAGNAETSPCWYHSGLSCRGL